MEVFHVWRGTKGFVSFYNYALRFRHMVTEAARTRAKVLVFWERYGDIAVKEAFGTSRRTLFRWQRALKEGGGKITALNAMSRAPHKKRARVVPDILIQRIIELRTLHPRLGKDKLHSLIRREGGIVSISTIGRILTDLKKRGRLPNPTHLSIHGRTGNLIERKPLKRKKKLRRPQGYHVLEVDTVVRFIDGTKRYILTGVDTVGRTAFAAAYTNHSSAATADFLRKATIALPNCPDALQTDNGSEFALHFERAAQDLALTHFHTYPRTPKMNAHVERFNRTLDEEFLCYHRALLRDDVRAFNDKLMDWLLWYNGERPHYALGQVAPFRYMMSLLPATECQMWWTHTCS